MHLNLDERAHQDNDLSMVSLNEGGEDEEIESVKEQNDKKDKLNANMLKPVDPRESINTSKGKLSNKNGTLFNSDASDPRRSMSDISQGA